MEAQRIAVLGTGANGGAIAADLTRAGLDVTLIEQWPAHVEHMRREGLRVETPEGAMATDVSAIHLCEVATLRHKFDVVFLVMKAYDTRWACELISSVLAPDGIVVGVQNGMTMDEIARAVGPERALGSVIEIASGMYEPGVIIRQTPVSGTWFAVGGEHPTAQAQADRIAEILGHAGTVEVSDDIRSSKWMKLVVNSTELVTSAILGLPLIHAIREPGMEEFMRRVGNESVDVAIAAGASLRPIFGRGVESLSDPHAFVGKLLDGVLEEYSLPDTKTTVLQDWVKHRRSEVDQLNGHIVSTAAEHGRQAPANERVVAVAHRIERGELELKPENARLLTGDRDG